MKKEVPAIFAYILIFLVGLSVALYPVISNWVNERSSSYVVAAYQDLVSKNADLDYEALMAEAKAFNETLDGNVQSYAPGSAQAQAYESALNLVDGVMGYIEIPTIDVHLPIYHGTAETVLQKAVGHLHGTALPTGDPGNRTVLTGHTGLPSAELFTDLDDLVIGDTFQLLILNEIFTYEIYDIQVVEPHEVDNLRPEEGRDLVTLVTCTPYGVNSHRLLVHGERIFPPEEAVKVTATATASETTSPLAQWKLPAAIVLAVLVMVALPIGLMAGKYGKRRKKEQEGVKDENIE